MSEREFLEELPFSIDALVTVQLGRESISSSLTAITELVKNAYDADAESVRLKLIEIPIDKKDKEDKEDKEEKEKKEKQFVLVIEDDGNGMSVDQIKENWLRIGTGNKRKRTTSDKKERILTGAKGLGRLGIDRLCNKLIFQTKIETEDKAHELEVNWEKFSADDGQSVSDIKNSIFLRPSVFTDKFGKFPAFDKNKGTRLCLYGLKDNWDKEFIGLLRKELSLLVSPFSGVNDFRVEVITGDDVLDGVVNSSELLDAAEGYLEATIDSDSNVTLEINSRIFGKTSNDDPIAWKEWIKKRGKVASCGPLTLKMYYIPKRSEQELKEFNFKSKDIRHFVKNNNGIRIYRDKFRVKPYGEPGGLGDFLNLAYRRSVSPGAITQSGWRVGLHQIIGAIFISRENNPQLADQTNREGLVEEPPFFDLTSFSLAAVNKFEMKMHEWAVEAKNNTSTEEASENFNELTKDIENSIQDIEDTFKENDDNSKDDIIVKVKELKKKVDQTIQSKVKLENAYKEEYAKFEQDKDTLSNLASLGILTVSFGHEVKGATNMVELNANNLKRAYDSGKLMLPLDTDGLFKKYIDRVIRNAKYIDNFASFALENVKKDKRTRKNINIVNVAKYVISNFKAVLKKKNIDIDLVCEIVNPEHVKGYTIDWESIFVNLITNSTWALEDSISSKRNILITITQDASNQYIYVDDSGIGIEAGTEDLIFKSTYSTRRNRRGEVVGTGMGLAIVKTFIENHSGGSITIKSPGPLGGAQFTIIVPFIK